VAEADGAGVAADVEVDAAEEVAEGDVGLFLAPAWLLFAGGVVAGLGPDVDEDLGPDVDEDPGFGGVVEAAGAGGEFEHGALPLRRTEQHDAVREIPVVLGGAVGGARLIELSHLLFTGDRV